jgi:hypothetical protein
VKVTTYHNSVISLALGAMLLALGFPAEAQQPKKVPQIGYVSGTGRPSDPGPRENRGVTQAW